MTIRKTFLLGGVILMVASGALAGQRTRGGDSVRGGGTGSAAAPVFQEVAPGVASMTINGVTTTVNERNLIGLDEVIAQYGSVEQYQAVLITSGTPSAPDSDGTSILASNSIGMVPGFVSPSAMPKTVESRMLEVVSMEATTPAGERVVVFADGAVGLTTDERGPASYRTSIPTVSVPDGEIAADGAIRF